MMIRQRIHVGYYSVNIGYPKQKFHHVHRLVATAFCENPHNGTIVYHKTSDIYNNNAENLTWNKHEKEPREEKKRTENECCDHTEICVILDWLPGYEILDDGRIYSSRARKFLVQHRNGNDYARVTCNLGGGVSKLICVHKLVAEAYQCEPTPEQTEVNHLDGDKYNNYFLNLQWCTPSENVIHSKATNPEQHAHLKRTISRLDINTGEVLETYSGLKEASRKTGINSGSMSKACNGIRPSAGGYKWKYN
jgi:hypothetical protein